MVFLLLQTNTATCMENVEMALALLFELPFVLIGNFSLQDGQGTRVVERGR